MCGISNQIAIHCDEPEVKECPRCVSEMTEEDSGDIVCDNCDYTLGEDD